MDRRLVSVVLALIAILILVLEPRKIPPRRHRGIANLLTKLVDANDLNLEPGKAVLQLTLHHVEVAKLATAVSSRGVPEVPGRDLLQVIARRDRLRK